MFRATLKKMVSISLVMLWLSTTGVGGANILFVTVEDDPLDADDAPIVRFLEGLGHTIILIDDDEDEPTTEAAALEADVVFISESVNSARIRTEITEVETPMIVAEAWAWDEMGLTTGTTGGLAATSTDIDIVKPGHFLAAGLSGTVPVLNSIGSSRHGTGIAGNQATVIARATLSDGQTYDVIYVYEKGAALPVAPADGSAQVAAEMRICFCFDELSVVQWNDNAYALLKAAVNYAIGITNQASNPDPSDGQDDVPRDLVMSWTPAEGAQLHNLYLGATFEDVNSADAGSPLRVGPSMDANLFDPGLLEYGQTYYWRIDEIGAPPESEVFKGNAWSFTIEPYAYPITGVVATASSFQVDMGPENTVNGSGLNAQDQHSIESTEMWLTSGAQPAWIQFELPRAEKLYEMWVWNSNQLVEAFIGFGVRDVSVEYSLDGETWTALRGVPEFAQAAGAPTYTHNTTVAFGGAVARYVKLTIKSSWGGAAPQTGLSEVRFFSVPVQARAPIPAEGATGVALDIELNWRPGREATSHKVFLGADANAVATGAVAGQTVTEHSYTPGALDFGTTYFWKVDEVGGAGTYPGNVWRFTSQEFQAIDDMESYNDDDNRIYQAWIDGVTSGTSGSTVGYFQAPFAERTIVHGGVQSMPLAYDNTAAPFFSQAEREFATARNWTVTGADTLSLWVRGNPAPFVEEGGTITMSGGGHDIWDNADDFRFAHKTLGGDGSIVVKVESIENTNAWAKAGVMIRQNLDADSKFVYMIQSFSSGISLGWRPTAAGGCSSRTQAGITAPQWVKLTRKGDVFTAQYSADGKVWIDLKAADGATASTTVAMTNPVYVGLCVTSHNTAATTTAVMSGATATGTVTGGSWQVLAIGDDPQPANDPAELYVTVEDSSGKTATATNPTAVTTGAWTEWQIPLNDFAGVNMARVEKLILGVDSRNKPVKGAGMIHVDDIGVGHPVQ